MVLELLGDRLPVTRKAIDSGLRWARLPGRIETIGGRVEQVLDVSHNAQAAEALADALRRMPLAGRTHAVLGMMRDKDVASFVRLLQPLVENAVKHGHRDDGRIDLDDLIPFVPQCGSAGSPAG